MSETNVTTVEAPKADHPVVGWLWRIVDPRREDIASPLTVHHDGKAYTFATSGHVLAMREGEYGFREKAERLNLDRITWLEMKSEPVAFPLADARALAATWLAPDLRVWTAPCDECKNSGQIECDECNGIGEYDCTCHCGDEHKKECTVCDGYGWVACECGRAEERHPPRETTRIGIGTFDARLLSRVLPFIPDGAATWQQDDPERQGKLVVGEWTIILMPLRPDSSEVKYELHLGAAARPPQETSA